MAFNPLFIFRSDSYKATATFDGFGKYVFPQLQICSPDCTEESCPSNIPNSFYQLFSF